METTEQANEEKKKPKKPRFTLISFLVGDFLVHDFLRRQAKLFMLIVVLTIFYIDNRYNCQQDMLEIDKLKKELVSVKYDALTVSSEVAVRSRQSRIEQYIETEGTHLEVSTTPPYLIKDKKK